MNFPSRREGEVMRKMRLEQISIYFFWNSLRTHERRINTEDVVVLRSKLTDSDS